MMTKGAKFLLGLFLLAATGWGITTCKYYSSYYADLNDRPWAYSRDENPSLLVGMWQGEFRDPDNVAKSIRLEILSPMSDEERAQKANRWARKRNGLWSRTDKKRFAGFAAVTSPRGQENYEFNGHVKTEDGHLLDGIDFANNDAFTRLRNNFNLRTVARGGQWQGDKLTLTLGFTFTTSTGASYSSSADPRFDKRVTVHLSRVKP